MKRCIAILLLIIAHQLSASEKALSSKEALPRSISVTTQASDKDLPSSSSSFSTIGGRPSVSTRVWGGAPVSEMNIRPDGVERGGSESEFFLGNPVWEAYCHRSKLKPGERGKLEASLGRLMNAGRSHKPVISELKSRLRAADEHRFSMVTRRSKRNHRPEDSKKIDKTHEAGFGALMTQFLIQEKETLAVLVQSLEADTQRERRNFKISTAIAIVGLAWGIVSTVWAAS